MSNCLLTGATGGLGVEILKRLHDRGHKVFITSSPRSQDKLDDLLKQYKGTVGCVSDLGDEKSVEYLLSVVERKLGHVDILINNAGVFYVNQLSEITEEDLETCINVNVKAPFRLSQACCIGMIERGHGTIVNIGSSSSYGGSPNTSIYCMSKHALLGMSRALYEELKPHGIRVICISPASIKTDMVKKTIDQDFSTFLEPAHVADYIDHAMFTEGNLIIPELRLNRMVVR